MLFRFPSRYSVPFTYFNTKHTCHLSQAKADPPQYRQAVSSSCGRGCWSRSSWSSHQHSKQCSVHEPGVSKKCHSRKKEHRQAMFAPLCKSLESIQPSLAYPDTSLPLKKNWRSASNTVNVPGAKFISNYKRRVRAISCEEFRDLAKTQKIIRPFPVIIWWHTSRTTQRS